MSTFLGVSLRLRLHHFPEYDDPQHETVYNSLG